MIKKLLGCLLLWALVFCPRVEAKGEFKSDFKIRYELTETGRTKISQQVTLTNQLATVYATQYTFTLTAQPDWLVATQGNQKLKTEIKNQGSGVEVAVNLAEPVLGREKSLTFNLDYEIEGVARKNGQIWEVNLPRLENDEEIDQYTATLAVPANFGPVAIFKPQLPPESQENGFRLYSFTKAALLKGGITAVFGTFQTFNFTLTYHLNNDDRPGVGEIALPPDTVWQKVIYDQLEPEPNRIQVDEDGNWLAQYELAPHQKLVITAQGQVLVFAEPQSETRQWLTGPNSTSLQEEKFWPVNDPFIKDKAKKFRTGKEIYDFVVKELNYDFTRINKNPIRLGAKQALLQPTKAICMEFTDLFVTLARAAGIPAREVEGYAYTNNPELKPLSLVTDVLHSWPEFWSQEKQLWQPVDPTWEKTTKGIDFFNKTDLNHFAFVIHGQSSEQPYPAGAYRDSTATGKDVQVSYGRYRGEIPSSVVDVTILLPPKVIEEANEKVVIRLRNQGPTAKYHYQVSLKVGNEVKNREIKILPPKAQETLEFPLAVQTKWRRQRQEVKVTAENKTYESIIVVGSWLDRGLAPIKAFLKI